MTFLVHLSAYRPLPTVRGRVYCPLQIGPINRDFTRHTALQHSRRREAKRVILGYIPLVTWSPRGLPIEYLAPLWAETLQKFVQAPSRATIYVHVSSIPPVHLSSLRGCRSSPRIKRIKHSMCPSVYEHFRTKCPLDAPVTDDCRFFEYTQ